jgi:hypothetical protein
MKRWITLGVLLTTVVLFACKSDGTCVNESTCDVNTRKDMCSKGEFFPEQGTAGVIRCKSAGFRSSGSRESDEFALKKGNVLVFVK